MPKFYTYENINQSFEKAVVQLQDNIQYLANEGKVSNKFIALQNSIIKALINYQHQTERIISDLEWEVTELARGKVNEIERLKKVQESFEAICIIHGIMDFPIWMNKGNRYLVHEAIYNYRNKIIQLPELLKEKFDQLPKEEKNVLDKILYKAYDDEIAQLKKKLAALKQKKK